MLRRVGLVSTHVCGPSTAPAIIADLYGGPHAHHTQCERTVTASSALTLACRSFFPPGPPGKDFLRHLTHPSQPTQAFSPLESLRPPAPPSAADAQPFGSLNRTNQLRRYVNVNTASSQSSAEMSSGSGEAAVPSTSAATSTASVPPSASSPQMDLSKLLHRHPSAASRTASTADSSDPSTRTPGASSSSIEQAETTSAAAPAATAAAAARPGVSAHTTVAKAQAAIAAAAVAAQLRKDAKAAGSSSVPQGSTTQDKATHAAASGASSHGSRYHTQVYREHCTIGWQPEEFYRVVADVQQYADFLPWCAGSEVHSTRRVRVPRGRRWLAGNLPGGPSSTPSEVSRAGAESPAASPGMHAEGSGASAATSPAIAAAEAELVDAIEMTATLTIGFSFLKEQYTSRVTLYPGNKIVAALYDEESDAAAAHAGGGGGKAGGGGGAGLQKSADQDGFVLSLFKKAASTAGAAAKRSILKHLLCEWEFCPVPGKPNLVEVVFSVSFEFKNPMHGRMIMSNVVTLMTRSFERRCESLYGPPSASKESLPLLF